MENLFIPKKYASSKIIERSYVEEQGVRLFRSSPDDLTLQIRTHTEKQGRMTLVSLKADESRKLAAALLAGADEIDGIAEAWAQDGARLEETFTPKNLPAVPAKAE